MVKSHTNQKHKKQKYEKQKHEKKMKLMRKPIWWVELLVAAAVCTDRNSGICVIQNCEHDAV